MSNRVVMTCDDPTYKGKEGTMLSLDRDTDFADIILDTGEVIYTPLFKSLEEDKDNGNREV